MSEKNPENSYVAKAAEAKIDTRRGFSIIWVIPLIALIIGGWLAFKALSEKGPVITIRFETAEGLEAGKTKIKFKEVDVGEVTQVTLSENLSGVIVTAEMSKEAKAYMTDKTRFWVVRARVAGGSVSGLGTLLSGAYIGCSPSTEGKQTHHFVGLEKAPLVTADMPGRHFVLQARELGSLDLGSPAYYRGIKVGQVVDYEYDHDRDGVDIKLFVEDPFHKKVLINSRFWNASGVDFAVDASGFRLNTESLVSVLLGGVAFDLREHDQPGKVAEENQRFTLYQDKESSREDTYDLKRYYLMYFDQSVRGLTPGAPVEIKGIQVGEVVSVELQFDMQKLDFRIPVLVVLEPERLSALVSESGELVKGAGVEDQLEDEASSRPEKSRSRTRALIDKGFRARLKPGNLLTGQLYIDLDFYPDAPFAEAVTQNGYEVFPTLPTALEEIVERVDNILKKVEQIPFDEIGKELQTAIAELTATLQEVKGATGQVNRETVPRINDSLDRFQETLAGIEHSIGPDSALNYNARNITSELSIAIRSIRSLLEYLERDPQALLLGKEGDKK